MLSNTIVVIINYSTGMVLVTLLVNKLVNKYITKDY